MTGGHYDVDVELRDPMKNVLYKEVGATLFDLLHTGCLRNYRKPILLLRVSVWKGALFAVYICGNIWNALFKVHPRLGKPPFFMCFFLGWFFTANPGYTRVSYLAVETG